MRKMHIDEVDIDESLIRRLVDTQFPQWSNLPITKVKSAGTSNALYRLGDKIVVRLPRTESASLQIDKEQQFLPKLASFLPLSIPLPIALGVSAEGYPYNWSIYQWLEGKDASIAPIKNEFQTAIALAEFILALQQINLMNGPPPGKHNFFRGEPLSMRDDETCTAIATLRSNFDKDLLIETWKYSLETPIWNKPPCWIHGDLIPTNLLIQDGTLSAIIDFGGLGVGDPACDLLVAWTFLSSETRDIFRSTLTVDDATWIRGRGWALSMGLIAYEYYLETNPILAYIAKRAIDEAVADYKIPKNI